MDLFSSVSWLSVVAAFVPYFMLGGLWFTVFFKKPYSISLGKENNMPEKPAPIFIVGPALCTLVITIASALLMSALPIDSYGSAMALAVLVGIATVCIVRVVRSHDDVEFLERSKLLDIAAELGRQPHGYIRRGRSGWCCTSALPYCAQTCAHRGCL